MYVSNNGTSRHKFTIGTGVEALCLNAVPDFTFETVAELHTGLPAAGTINHHHL